MLPQEVECESVQARSGFSTRESRQAPVSWKRELGNKVESECWWIKNKGRERDQQGQTATLCVKAVQ